MKDVGDAITQSTVDVYDPNPDPASDELRPLQMQDIDPRSCNALFVAVLRECINVALGHGYKVSRKEFLEAQEWLDSADFAVVCELAHVDVCEMRAGVELLRAQGVKIDAETHADAHAETDVETDIELRVEPHVETDTEVGAAQDGAASACDEPRPLSPARAHSN
jgi:hypothetical protein